MVGGGMFRVAGAVAVEKLLSADLCTIELQLF